MTNRSLRVSWSLFSGEWPCRRSIRCLHGVLQVTETSRWTSTCSRPWFQLDLKRFLMWMKIMKTQQSANMIWIFFGYYINAWLFVYIGYVSNLGDPKLVYYSNSLLSGDVWGLSYWGIPCSTPKPGQGHEKVPSFQTFPAKQGSWLSKLYHRTRQVWHSFRFCVSNSFGVKPVVIFRWPTQCHQKALSSRFLQATWIQDGLLMGCFYLGVDPKIGVGFLPPKSSILFL